MQAPTARVGLTCGGYRSQGTECSIFLLRSRRSVHQSGGGILYHLHRKGSITLKTAFRNGFTLLELLAAMTVLVMILLLFTQIFGHASKASEGETRKISSFSGAIGAFDRLSMDLAMRVRGENALAVSSDGKTLSFFTQVRNSGGSSRASLVTYLIKDGKLLRNVKPTQWSDSMTQPIPASDGEVLSDEIFGLQFSFMRRDGFVYPGVGTSLSQNSSLIATFACLDRSSRQRFHNAEVRLNELNLSALNGVSASGSALTPLSFWDAISLSEKAGELESAIRSHVSFYERRYALD